MDRLEMEDNFYAEVEKLGDLKLMFSNSDFDFNDKYMTTAKKDVILSKISKSQEYADAWKRNYSSVFYSDLKTRLLNGSNFFMRFFGSPFSGKSFVGLYIAYLSTMLGFQYQNLFSTSQAQILLSQNSYNVAKGKESPITKMLFNIDETQQKWGVGSKASNVYFQQLTEFMRALQICITIINPNDTSDAETQLETIGYTLPDENGVIYTKSMIYYLIDKRSSIYKPIGYLVTKTPPKNFIDAYLLQKDQFLKNFSSNRNPNAEKNDILNTMVWNDMSSQNKDFLSKALLLNKENYVQAILKKEFSVFNLPSQEQKELIESFKLKYFKKEIQAGWATKLANMKSRVDKANIPQGIKTVAVK